MNAAALTADTAATVVIDDDTLDEAIGEALESLAGDLWDWWRYDRRRMISHCYGAARALVRIDHPGKPLPAREDVEMRLRHVLGCRGVL